MQFLEDTLEKYQRFISGTSERMWRFELQEKISINQSAWEQLEAIYELAFVAECNKPLQ